MDWTGLNWKDPKLEMSETWSREYKAWPGTGRQHRWRFTVEKQAE